MNFYIDPYILAVEKELISKEQLEEFIENLLDWNKLIDLNWGEVYKPIESFELLFKHNLYPLVDKVKELIDKFNIDYIQPEEIDKIINAILTKLPSIEESFNINDLLFTDDIIDLKINRQEDFLYLLKKIAIIIQLDCIINHKEASKQIILSKELKTNQLTFNTVITLIESNHKITTPYNINVNISNAENFNSFCSISNPLNIWKYGHSSFCSKMALNIKLFQSTNNTKYLDYNNKSSFRFLDSFHNSVVNLGFKNEFKKIEMLLRTLTEDILQINMNSTHELRKSKSGNSDQKTCGDYSAWRRDIDYEYHLHYWKKGDFIVFADVVNHNNFKITNI